MNPVAIIRLLMGTLTMGAAGFAVGVLYFAALWRTAQRLTARDGWLEPAILTVGRFSAALGVLILAAKVSALALLSAFLGFLLARGVVLRTRQRAAG